MTAADLLAYISTEGLDPTPSEEAFADVCHAQALALVARHVGGTVALEQILDATVPEVILERATLEVGAELFYRRDTKNGISQFMSTDGGQGMRVARDPMVAAYPLLAPFVGRGIA